MQKVETVCVTDISEFDLGEFCATGNNGPSATAWIIFVVCMLAALAYAIWNYGYRQGTTGSSVGKSFAKFKVVSEKTGQPIGFGPSIIRQIAHAVDGHHLLHRLSVSTLGRQAAIIADKIMSTICVPSSQATAPPFRSDRNLYPRKPRPATTPTARRLPAPAAGWLSATPAARRLPATPAARRLPAAPAAKWLPAAPAARAATRRHRPAPTRLRRNGVAIRRRSRVAIRPPSRGYPPPQQGGYPPAQPGYPPAPGAPALNVGEAFSWAWNKFSKNVAAIIVPTLVYAVIAGVLFGIVYGIALSLSPDANYESSDSGFSYSASLGGASFAVLVLGGLVLLVVIGAIQSAFIWQVCWTSRTGSRLRPARSSSHAM